MKDCFSTTRWDIFKEASTCNDYMDIEEYTKTVIACNAKCTNAVTHCKTICVHANQKPRLTGEVHRLLRTQDTALKAGDTTGNSQSQPVPRY